MLVFSVNADDLGRWDDTGVLAFMASCIMSVDGQTHSWSKYRVPGEVTYFFCFINATNSFSSISTTNKLSKSRSIEKCAAAGDMFENHRE